MTQESWLEVDRFIEQKLVHADAALEATLEANRLGGLPSIDVSPAQGKMLRLFAKMIGARRVLEIGTLGGYSTIWLARALPEKGVVVTLEALPQHAAVAQANISRAGLAERVDLRLGAAVDSLAKLAAEGAAPFDLIFIDADKRSNPQYFDWAIKLARIGSVIVVDNVVRHGAIVDLARRDEDVEGIRRFFEQVGADKRLDATAIQTVGGKGWDGFALIRVDSL